jgi:hypothetical protein
MAEVSWGIGMIHCYGASFMESFNRVMCMVVTCMDCFEKEFGNVNEQNSVVSED